MIRAVIDTNVLVSGLLSPAGNEALIILAIHQGLVRPCLSEEIIEEYVAVLARPKFAFPPDDIAALIATLRDRGELFRVEASPTTSPDPGTRSFCTVRRPPTPISLSPATNDTSLTRPAALPM